MVNVSEKHSAEVVWLLRIGTGIISTIAVVGIVGGITLNGTLSTIQTDIRWMVKSDLDLTADVESIGTEVQAVTTNQEVFSTRLDAIDAALEVP